MQDKSLRLKINSLINNSYFEVISTLMISINIIILCQEQYPETSNMKQLQHISNSIFTLFYFLEFLLRLFAEKKYFFKNFINVFDLIVVTLSSADVILSLEGSKLTHFKSIKSLRMLRVFKLVHNWDMFRYLLSAITLAFQHVLQFIFLIFLFIFILALIGVQFFQY